MMGSYRRRHYRHKLCCGLSLCRVKLKYVLLFTLALFLLYFVHLHQTSSSIKSALVIRSRPTTSSQIVTKTPNKVILFWTSFFEWPNYGFGFGYQPFLDHKCAVSSCEITNDRSRIADADAVIFHIRNLNVADLPTVRYADQRWIFYLYEQPQLTWLDLQPLGNLFNWTMTYRRDSDIPMMQFNTKLKPTTENDETSIVPTNYADGKTKKATWLVSNCYHAFSHRDRYVSDLKNYIDVDIIGRCGWKMPGCYPKGDYNKCYKLLEKDYKFYLSFENSVCKDYVTEKWSNVVKYNMIPIVMGGADYEKFAPPHSFINVKDFQTPRQLAEYLNILDANDSLYNEYFEWKQKYEVYDTSRSFCDLCSKLHEPNLPLKSYKDIHRWWVGMGNCSGVFDLPPNELTVFTKYFDYIVDSLIFFFGGWIYGILTRFWF